jgi:uncharacterized DUF497 family protein
LRPTQRRQARPAHTEQEEALRIISARLATGPEPKIYEEG